MLLVYVNCYNDSHFPLCHQESVLGGPVFFNPAIKALMEGMDKSGECSNYIFMATKPCRGSGDVPMFKKDDSAAAAERAEERMRGDLEKLWWNGMREDEKVSVEDMSVCRSYGWGRYPSALNGI